MLPTSLNPREHVHLTIDPTCNVSSFPATIQLPFAGVPGSSQVTTTNVNKYRNLTVSDFTVYGLSHWLHHYYPMILLGHNTDVVAGHLK